MIRGNATPYWSSILCWKESRKRENPYRLYYGLWSQVWIYFGGGVSRGPSFPDKWKPFGGGKAIICYWKYDAFIFRKLSDLEMNKPTIWWAYRPEKSLWDTLHSGNGASSVSWHFWKKIQKQDPGTTRKWGYTGISWALRLLYLEKEQINQTRLKESITIELSGHQRQLAFMLQIKPASTKGKSDRPERNSISDNLWRIHRGLR